MYFFSNEWLNLIMNVLVFVVTALGSFLLGILMLEWLAETLL